MSLGARIDERMTALGLSQAELARRVGVSQPAIHALLHRNKTGSKNLHAVARELQTTTAYLNGETNDPLAGAIPAPTERDIAEHLDLVPIASIDQEYGLGGAFIADHVEHEIMQFPRAWVESFTRTPSNLLTFARGRGDSMQPTIHCSDMVLIDRSQRTVAENDAIWAYAVGEIGGIKRLRIRGDRVIILSDNPSVPPDEAMADEITIVGRVIMIIRSI